jgi:nucleotide-binding universal stress UspA family protein
MIKKILLPTDGSDRSMDAVRYAIDLAKQTNASILVLSVVDERFKSIETAPDPVAFMESAFMESAKTYVEAAENEIKKEGISVSKSVRIGNPADEIVKEAEESGIDLIVIGSHGRTRIQSALLGSVTMSVIHKETNIPVLIIRKGVKI